MTNAGPMPGVAASVAAIVRAAGEHVPLLLASVEVRLAEIAQTHGPLLVLLAAGREPDDPRELLACAAAVELVHSATLVHDDVLDSAALRRGLPTVWAQGGRELAVATGDLLFSRAFAELAAVGTIKSVRALSRASSALAEGELLQREDAWNAAVAVERYLYRCELKTARLFEAACELGAIAAGEHEAHVAALGAFGLRLGLAFQLLDDVLDVSGAAQQTGKHRGTDLLDGTVTLPLILARRRDEAIAAIDLHEIATPQQAIQLCERIEATGALADARAQAQAIVVEAKQGLGSLELGDGQRTALDLVADSVVDRHA